MSRITDIAKTMKTWWNEDDDPFVHRALDEIIRIDQEQLPTIEPKRGEWIEDYNNTYGQCRMKCSVCGKFSGIGGIKSNQRKPYCPNCGARMKGADDDLL